MVIRLLPLLVSLFISCASGMEYKVMNAAEASNTLFEAAKGVPHTAVIEKDLNVRVIMFPNTGEQKREYRVRRGHDLMGEHYAFYEVTAAGPEIWIPYKRLSNGHIVLPMWALAHEVEHALGIELIDEMGKREWWE